MIQKNVPLKDYTYTKIGGNADYLAIPESIEELTKAVTFAKKNNIPWMVLGNGSNVLIQDGGIEGLVILTTSLTNMTIDIEKVTVQAGAPIIEVSRAAHDHSLSGLEFACGIPGSVGGAIYMNAGAYGGEIKDVCTHVTVLTPEGNVERLPAEKMAFDYRTSAIPDENWIVLEAEFVLEKADQHVIKAKMDELTYLRESKQPLEYPSCGSVFKRPPGHFAGKLIQESDLQGVQIGGAQVSLKHAGFIVNKGDATAKDYLNLVKHVQKTVKEKFGVDLEKEVRVIGRT
ncbi:UDP-N-acetylenolpyruvoylglucosamine reductase [Jeotgalibacillus malaysiensis]|uniref:UDP-N-acetylenolpyruvoylglucosamine reductase n=1 Tax=Jeotgalibacillus malaysiensis TaxID=1508404 RepID=A0A0B5AN51_9BACL|nr:UDP-N-acetylenolpyruvoylglucosamine reductase [Jeotgalibacillus malaysiensis]